MASRASGLSSLTTSTFVLDSKDEANSTTEPVEMKEDKEVESLRMSWVNKVSQTDSHPRLRASAFDKCQQQGAIAINLEENERYHSERVGPAARAAEPSYLPSSPISLDSKDEATSTTIPVEIKDDQKVERLHTSLVNNESQTDGHPRLQVSHYKQCQHRVAITINCEENSQYHTKLGSPTANRAVGSSGLASASIVLDSKGEANSTRKPLEMKEDQEVEKLHISWVNKASQTDGYPRLCASPFDQCQQRVAITINCVENAQYHSEIASPLETRAAGSSVAITINCKENIRCHSEVASPTKIRAAGPSPIILDSKDEANSTMKPDEMKDDQEVERLHTSWVNKVSQTDGYPRLVASPIDQRPQRVTIGINCKENAEHHSELTSPIVTRAAGPSCLPFSIILDSKDEANSTTIPVEVKEDQNVEKLDTSWVNKVSQTDVHTRLRALSFNQCQQRNMGTACLLHTQDFTWLKVEDSCYLPAFDLNYQSSHSSSVSFASDSTFNAKYVWQLNKSENAGNVSLDNESTRVKWLSSGTLNKYCQPRQRTPHAQNVLNAERTVTHAHQHVKWGNNVENHLKLSTKLEWKRNSSSERMKTEEPTSYLPRRLSSFGSVDEETFLEQCSKAYSKPVDFEDFMKRFSRPTKIGEGSYGDVYCCFTKVERDFIAMKVIPVDGLIPIRDDKQPAWSEMLPNLITSLYLNTLDEYTSPNWTSNFVHLYSVHCVIGEYPDTLLKAWEKHKSQHGSENENPDILNKDQKYLVMMYDYAGIDLQHFEHTNVARCLSIFLQVACSLAVAEKALQFEHRNLHLGNILLKPAKENEIHFRMEGKDFHVSSHAIHATLIDFSLSRLKKGNRIIFTDLSKEPCIFQGVGDYQFELYHIMRDCLNERWESFCPKTNVIWLHYLLVKMFNGKQYKVQRPQHREMMHQLTEYIEQILTYKSAYEFVTKHVKGQV